MASKVSIINMLTVYSSLSGRLRVSKTSRFEGLVLPMIPAISAGFPSPAADFIDVNIDLGKELIRNPSSSFLGRVRGNSMQDVGIGDRDILIIDKSLPADDGRIAVCFLDGDFTVKRIQYTEDGCWLVAENPKFKPIKVTKENDFVIWGIVVYVIKAM